MDDKPRFTSEPWWYKVWKPNVGSAKQTERIRAKKIGATRGTASRMAYRRWMA